MPSDLWIDCFKACHRLTEVGMQRYEWPNGGYYESQDNILVLVFIIMRDEINTAIHKDRERQMRKHGNK